jgi:Na+-translocating ferredoxin:NAD+ oxidoreductase RnfG subunit
MAWTLEEFNLKKPKSFDVNRISSFLSFLDRQRDDAEIYYDEIKDQLNEALDFVILEKKSNNKCSVAEAKSQATQDKRYQTVQKEYRDAKKIYLYWKSLAKNGLSHCDNLKTETINQLAIDKLTTRG